MAQEYVAKDRTPASDKSDLAALMHMELDAQCKQFDFIMKQNSALLVAMAKVHGGGGGRGSGGGGSRGSGGGGSRRRDSGTMAMCPNCNKMVVQVKASCYTLLANKDNIPSWYKPLKMN